MSHVFSPELIALGEVLIDFTQAGFSANGQALFERNAGGAPANVAVQAARLGMPVQFVGKVGTDMHGDFLKRALQECGVDVSSVAQDPDAFTTLAFVEVDPLTAERSFSFARKLGADTRLSPADVPDQAVRACRVLHVGSLSLTDEPARSATLHAVELARQAGALISYDPNYRASLWPTEHEAIERMETLLHRADLVKINEDEAVLLCGTNDADKAARRILDYGAALVAVTLGSQGALIATRAENVFVPTFPCQPRDATGAGDSFWGAFLYRLVHEQEVRTAGDLAALSREELLSAGSFACAAASCCVERPGAIPAMPGKREVFDRLAQ